MLGGREVNVLKVLVAGVGGIGASLCPGECEDEGLFEVAGFVVAKNVERVRKLPWDLTQSN
jgi:hypothetical protein